MIRSLPAMYYSQTDRPVVIDKCRSWTLPLNVEMIERYITPQPKMICCVRDVPQIIESFERLFTASNLSAEDRLPFMSELDMSLAGLDQALQTGDDSRYLIVSYDRLIDHTTAVLDEIYDFLEMPRYVHDLGHIVNMTPENDAVYGLSGMHDVRPQIARRDAQ
jgi:sulfotransferase